MKIALSSGHGAKISGAVGIIKEHQEAVKVVNATAKYLRVMGVTVVTFEDLTSTTQNQNLKTIVDWHNNQDRDLDVSVHFNSSNGTTNQALGTECWYLSQAALAGQVAEEMAGASGLIDRGAKKSTGLYFLKNTHKPAILDEVCFVNSEPDVKLYKQNFDNLCEAFAAALAGEKLPVAPSAPDSVLLHVTGKCSWFGGPDDTGVSSGEGLAFISNINQAPHLFLQEQPAGTTGLARRLNPDVFYLACRWDYSVTSKATLLNASRHALVKAKGKSFLAWPADWGPNEDTGRVADLSPGLLKALDLTTDDQVEVTYPAEQPNGPEA